MSSNLKQRQDWLKEWIKFLTEIMKLLFGVLIATTAGTIAIIFKYLSGTTPPKEVLFVLFGLVLAAAIGLVLIKLSKIIINHINEFDK